ncbi:MAG: glycosyltransferase family 39 protein [Patescibacteria group bacterium]|nr:glycosyltransferase family 39 protein [Patescibacteria group bacterium]
MKIQLIQHFPSLHRIYSKIKQRFYLFVQTNKKLTNKIFIISILVVFVWGLLLRKTRVLYFTTWSSDVSRDLLIAKHISEFKEFTNAAPFNGSSFKALKNSPLYFYTVALLWTLGKSHLGATILHATLSAINVVVIALITQKLLKNKVWAFLASVIAAKSEALTYYSTAIFQPHLLPLASNLAILFWIIAYQNKSLKYLYFSLFFLLLGLNIHYSQILLLPGFGLLTFITLKSIHKHKKSLAAIILFLFSQVVLFSTWLYFILDDYFRQKLASFFKLNTQSTRISAFKIMTHLNKALFHLVPNHSELIVFYTLLVLTIASLIVFQRYKKINKSSKYLLLTFGLGFIIVFFYRGNIERYYVTPLYSLFIICLIILWSKSNKIIIILSLALILFNKPVFYKTTLKQILNPVYQENPRKTATRKLSKKILQDYKTHNRNKNTTFDICHNWLINYSINKTSIWFFLEKFVDKQLIKIQTSPHYNWYSLIPQNQNIDTVYLLCIQPASKKTDCLHMQDISNYKSPIIDSKKLRTSKKKKIFLTSDVTLTYSIYRCTIPPKES